MPWHRSRALAPAVHMEHPRVWSNSPRRLGANLLCSKDMSKKPALQGTQPASFPVIALPFVPWRFLRFPQDMKGPFWGFLNCPLFTRKHNTTCRVSLAQDQLPNSCPASFFEPPPGLQEIPAWEECQIFIPPVHDVVPPPPSAPPVLPDSLKYSYPEYVSVSMHTAPAEVSVGSLNHADGTCKPCAFMHTKGCQSGADCSFCHLCPPGEKKRRAKLTKQAAKLSEAAGAAVMEAELPMI